MSRLGPLLVSVFLFSLGACSDDATGGGSAEPRFSFFVTSVGSGANGGNLGGLAGADQTCQNLAAAVDAGDRTWRAYLSTSTLDARDRIGTGPWYNVRLQEVARDVETLHEEEIPRVLWNAEDPEQEGLVIDENGALVPLSDHDILTGSEMDGTVFEGKTCLDWTSASENDVAQVGHSDITPPEFTIGGPDRFSWNSAHDTVSCTEEGLAELSGAGRFYCFAID
ncbi:MAG: hypothetical protein OEM15_16620 [Myxococcales bacterium]|nr:hypothetical protein [Myxococcales bacterium]MDH3484454.1 hypothetical protein [Myxococcales bacterium]